MAMWTIRFKGADERETLGRADHFFRENEEQLGLDREGFFSRLVLSEDGREAAFVPLPETSWSFRPGDAEQIAMPDDAG